jgi:hypothetical protein
MKHLLAVALAGAVLALASCATPPPPAPQADIGFSGAPLKLDVARVSVDNQYHPLGKAPNVEQLHETTPSTVASRWLQTRILPVGRQGEAVLKIYDARVVSEKLPVKGGLTGFFGDQLDSKLTGTLRVELIVSRIEGQATAPTIYNVKVSARAEQTILQSATLNDRDKAYFDLMQNLAREFDKTATAEINRAMRPILRN